MKKIKLLLVSCILGTSLLSANNVFAKASAVDGKLTKDVLCISSTTDLNDNSTDNSIIDESKFNFEPSDNDTPQIVFIKKLGPGAIQTYNEYKVLPSITLAQAILETGWGKSYLALNYNNYFGIKANSSWTGKTGTNPTRSSDISKWRIYDSVSDSLEDHGKFLCASWYRDAGIFEAKNYKEQAEAIFKGGYATNPSYVKKLCEIIQRYDLWEYDPNGESLS